jgi:hypothetical protein
MSMNMRNMDTDAVINNTGTDTVTVTPMDTDMNMDTDMDTDMNPDKGIFGRCLLSLNHVPVSHHHNYRYPVITRYRVRTKLC